MIFSKTQIFPKVLVQTLLQLSSIFKRKTNKTIVNNFIFFLREKLIKCSLIFKPPEPQ